MKIPSRGHFVSGGFSTIQLLIVGLLVAMAAFAGWAALREKTGLASDYHALSQQDFFSNEVKVREFYSCVDKSGGFEPGTPQTCDYDGETYDRPAGFVPENVRNMEYVPEGARGSVMQLARKNFGICDDTPDALSITRVLNVMDGFIYLATGCDDGHAVILARQGLAWKELNLGQNGLSCETAQEYGIPRKLIHDREVEGSGDCYEENGETRPLP